jgi:polar amino acid transport system substrate-binding protein
MGKSKLHGWYRHLLLTAVVAVAAAVAVAGCGSSGSSSTAEGGSTSSGGSESAPEGTEAGGTTVKTKPTNLHEEGKLTVCTDPSYPPLEYYGTDKKLAGYEIAVPEVAAEMMGLEAAFVPTPFNGILPALDAGRCDLAWSGFFVSKERLANFIAVPYQKTSAVIMVKGGNPEGIKTPEDLSGKTTATQAGTETLEHAEELSKELEAEGKGGFEVQSYVKFEEAVQQLLIGRAEAVFTQDLEASYRELKQPGQLEIAYRFPEAETFGVYMKPDDKALGESLYEALLQLEESGQLKEIAEEEGMPTEGIKVEPLTGVGIGG